jgi:peptide/nickel transport system substrate-binding protein
MRRIASTFPARGSSRGKVGLALLVAALSLCAGAGASVRPQFGGTLRVRISAQVASLDPRQWPAEPAKIAAAERLDGLVFDRLTRLDARGVPQPALATSWQHDAESKRWQFRIRENVKFTDGALLTPPVAAMALEQLLGASFDVSANSDSVIIQANHPAPLLPMQLSSGRYFIFHVGEDNSLSGTGPFRAAESQARDGAGSAKAVFVANETCWAGRPFLDKIEIVEGADTQQEVDAISFGQADVVELSPSEVRRAGQRGVRASSSDPVELLALAPDTANPALQDERVRRAISLAIDRVSIAEVILRKQGVAAGGLLPNWISGYAHLFPPSFDLPRAKELLAASGPEFSATKPLVLIRDSGDAEAQAVADRVAVNLREAGITVRVVEQSSSAKAGASSGSLRLIRRRLSAPDPEAALSEFLGSLGESSAAMQTLEEVCAAEQTEIDSLRVIPLVHVAESYGLSPQVRDWMAPRWGGWDLADVWLGPPSNPASGAQGSGMP